jgi:hypothetical protein
MPDEAPPAADGRVDPAVAVPDAPQGQNRHVALWTWLALGVIVAFVGTVVLVKVVGGSTAPVVPTNLTAVTPSVLQQITHIPVSVYDKVGVSSPVVPVTPPRVVRNLSALTFEAPDGNHLPGVLFWGAEFSPFAAAQRWPLIAALSRFGRFSTLYDMNSSPTDFAPSTPTFTFRTTSYKSDWVVFRSYEAQSDVRTPTGYQQLVRLSGPDRALVAAFDPTYAYPFVNVGNRLVVTEANLSPETFYGLTRDQVAGNLSDPTNPVTQAIVASANYLTAGICASDGESPAKVCDSSGVVAASEALQLTS